MNIIPETWRRAR